MKSVAIMPVRNEDWCLGLTLRALLLWVDCVIVMAHACTDDTHEILCEVAGEVGHDRLIWRTCDEPGWDEMAMRQKLLTYAREDGATHIVTLDADELLTGNLLHRRGPSTDSLIRGLVERIPDGSIMRLPGYNLRGGIHEFHANGTWSNRWFSAAFPDSLELHWSGDRFHQREPIGVDLRPWTPMPQSGGGILHLWGASERRLRAKHAWYRITERLRWPNKPIWRIEQEYCYATNPLAGGVKEWTYTDVPESWWAPYAHLMRHLKLDAVPWQEAEIERAIAEHRGDRFTGLDLLGY